MAKKYEVIVHNRTPAQVGDLLTSVNRLDNPMLKIFGLASTSKLFVKLEEGGFRIQSRKFLQHMSPVYVLASTEAINKGTHLKLQIDFAPEGRQLIWIFSVLYFCTAIAGMYAFLNAPTAPGLEPLMLIVFPAFLLLILPAALSALVIIPAHIQRRELQKEAIDLLRNTFPGLKEVSEQSVVWKLPLIGEKQAAVGAAWLRKPEPLRERIMRHRGKLNAVADLVTSLCRRFAELISCPELETLDATSLEMELAIPQSQLLFRLSRQQSDEGFALGVFDKRKFHIVIKNKQFNVRRKRLLTSPIAKLLLHFLDLETGQQLSGKMAPILGGTLVKLTWSQAPLIFPSPLIVILPLLVMLASLEIGAIIFFVTVLIYAMMIASRVQQKSEQFEILQFLGESMGECANGATLVRQKPLLIQTSIQV